LSFYQPNYKSTILVMTLMLDNYAHMPAILAGVAEIYLTFYITI